MRIITEPNIYVVGQTALNWAEIRRFLSDEDVVWQHDGERQTELMIELAGRLCYMAFGEKQFRKHTADYILNLLAMRHGSVIEHAVWNLIITGVSRSLTHELIRHRAGVGISQLSQRYVDESEASFVLPPNYRPHSAEYDIWVEQMKAAQERYVELVDLKDAEIQREHPEIGKIARRKMAREAARSVLPNATETKLAITMNGRALRHIVELRGSEGAEPEIRRLAVRLGTIMKEEAPTLFGDIEVSDGKIAVTHSKV